MYLGSRDLQAGQAIAAGLPTAPGNVVTAVQLDITSPESVAAAAATVQRECGRLDVLVNNAGANYPEIADEAAKMRALYEINVIGTWRVTDAFKPLLLAQAPESKGKRIIHVTSTMGSTASRFKPEFAFYGQEYTAYRCTKAALGMLSACHVYELKDKGVKVHAFDPGWAATELGGLDPATLRSWGAVDPKVSGLACRDIVEGKRDDENEVIVSINGDTYPW